MFDAPTASNKFIRQPVQKLRCVAGRVQPDHRDQVAEAPDIADRHHLAGGIDEAEAAVPLPQRHRPALGNAQMDDIG